jgi:hypothetical protein
VPWINAWLKRLTPIGLLVAVVGGIGLEWGAVVVGMLVASACDDHQRPQPISRWPLEHKACFERARVTYALSRDGPSLEVSTACDDEIAVSSCT